MVGQWLFMASFLELLSWMVRWGEMSGGAEGMGRDSGSPGMVKSLVILPQIFLRVRQGPS